MRAEMKTRLRVLSVGLCAVLGACVGSDAPSPAPAPPGGGNIRGGERVAWDQSASSPDELAKLRYAIYVDGVRSEIADVSCEPKGAAYACSGRLPDMPPGSHRIEIATFVLDGPKVVEGPRSPAFTVTRQ
jgi:hypothetical protein